MQKGFKDFDIDLKYGQIKEQKVKDMFKDCTIEVKSERNWWKKTRKNFVHLYLKHQH